MKNDKAKNSKNFREVGAGKLQSFALEIIPDCALKCTNCYRQAEIGAGPMPRSFVLKAISMAKKAGFSEIVFIGGEPSDHLDIAEFISFTLASSLTPILVTNGMRLADMEFCKSVAQSGTTLVLHGLVPISEEQMDAHVGKAGYTQQLKQAYRNLEEIRHYRDLSIVAEAVIIKPFLPYLLQFHAWCRQNNYQPYLETARSNNDGHATDLAAEPADVVTLFEALKEWDEKHYPQLAATVIVPPYYGSKCTMSITGLHIKNFGGGKYGTVHSCCAQSLSHGDLTASSLEEILDSTSLIVFQDQDDWIAGPCRSCGYYADCHGGCRGEAALTFGCIRASCPSCWHIPEEVRQDSAKMMPATCQGCPLAGSGKCQPKRR